MVAQRSGGTSSSDPDLHSTAYRLATPGRSLVLQSIHPTKPFVAISSSESGYCPDQVLPLTLLGAPIIPSDPRSRLET